MATRSIITEEQQTKSTAPCPHTFDDDEPLTAHPPPPLPQPSSSAAAAKTATVTTIPEFPAVAATASLSNFAVLVKTRAPPSNPSASDRAPVDLVAVLDVSGSMKGQKIALLKRAVHFILDTLGPSDRLSIVTFSNSAHRVLCLTRMTDPGRARATAAVDSLAASGSTNIKAGLEIGIRVLDERRHRNPVAGLILLSDGQDNKTLTGFHRKSDRPAAHEYLTLLPSQAVPVHTFGFGADHDPGVMHAIADASRGTFSFIDAEEDVQDAFAMCIGGLLSVVAQQVQLVISAASAGVLVASVDSGSYRSNILNHGLAASIDVGDLYADEEKDFLVHVSVPSTDGRATTMPLLRVNCSYKEPSTGLAVYVDVVTAEVRRPEQVSPEEQGMSLVVDGQRNRMLVARSIKEAQAKAEAGDMEGAKAVLTSSRAALMASPSAKAGDQLCVWLEAELQEIEKRMESRDVYRRSGRAYALSGVSSHMQQRAAAGAVSRRAYSMKKLQLSSGGSVIDEAEVATSNVGYQTPAMLNMVERSHAYARENPVPVMVVALQPPTGEQHGNQ